MNWLYLNSIELYTIFLILESLVQQEVLLPVLTALVKCARGNPLQWRYLRQKVLPSSRGAGHHLRKRLVKLLTTPVTQVRDLVADFLFMLCKENGNFFSSNFHSLVIHLTIINKQIAFQLVEWSSTPGTWMRLACLQIVVYCQPEVTIIRETTHQIARMATQNSPFWDSCWYKAKDNTMNSWMLSLACREPRTNGIRCQISLIPIHIKPSTHKKLFILVLYLALAALSLLSYCVIFQRQILRDSGYWILFNGVAFLFGIILICICCGLCKLCFYRNGDSIDSDNLYLYCMCNCI